MLAANANSRVRFVPNANFVGTVANGLTFRAWDQTIGNNGGTLAITVSSNTVLDRFTAVSYLNDDGTQLWSTRWMETELGAIGPASGYFKISGGQDQLQLAAYHTGDNIYREVNLIGATFATLSYWYDSTKFGQGVALQMEVSSDAGASYAPLKTYTWPGATGTESFDITPYISANTRIRYRVSTGQSVNNDFKTDNVQVAFLYPGGGPTAFSTNTASASLTVMLAADIMTTMNGPSAVSAGADFSYAVSVFNQGPSAANSVQVSQTLPAGVTFVSASNGGAYNGGEVTWSLAGLSSGVAANLTVTVTAPASGTLTSSVSSTALTSDPNAANNDGSAAAAQVVTTVTPQADIATTVTGPSVVSAGADFSYAVSVLNQGPSAANSVQVSQTLPAGVTFVSASNGGAYNGGAVTWSLAGLSSGVAANLTVTVTAPASGTLSSSVSSTALTSDPNAANNDGSAVAAQVVTTVTPQADIATTMTGPSVVSAGADFSYAVSVLNQGPSAANSVQVSQTLPAGVTFVSASNGGAYNGGAVTWSLAGLSSGVAANLTVTVTAPASGTLSSSVSSTALTSDPNAANNDGSAATAQVVTTVTPQADIVTTMSGPSAVSGRCRFLLCRERPQPGSIGRKQCAGEPDTACGRDVRFRFQRRGVQRRRSHLVTGRVGQRRGREFDRHRHSPCQRDVEQLSLEHRAYQRSQCGQQRRFCGSRPGGYHGYTAGGHRDDGDGSNYRDHQHRVQLHRHGRQPECVCRNQLVGDRHTARRGQFRGRFGRWNAQRGSGYLVAGQSVWRDGNESRGDRGCSRRWQLDEHRGQFGGWW